MEKVPAGVDGAEGVVVDVAVAVEALQVAGIANEGIGREEPADERVVDAPVARRPARYAGTRPASPLAIARGAGCAISPLARSVMCTRSR